MVVLLFGDVALVKLYFAYPWFGIVFLAALHTLFVLPIVLSLLMDKVDMFGA